MSENFIGINWGTEVVDLRRPGVLTEMRPVEVHLKEDGTLDNGPSLTFVLVHPPLQSTPIAVFGQISVKMLNEGLADIGYKIEKI